MLKEKTTMGLEAPEGNRVQPNFFNLVENPGQKPTIPVPESSLSKPRVPAWSVEEFIQLYNIPAQRYSSGRFPIIRESGYPEGIDVQFINSSTGLVEVDITFEEQDPSALKRLDERSHKPTQIRFYTYRPQEYVDPVTHKLVSCTSVVERTYQTDTRFRKRAREELRRCSIIPDPEWDQASGLPRSWGTVLVESVFEGPAVTSDSSVSRPEPWVEAWRSFLSYEFMLIFTRSKTTGKLILPPILFGDPDKIVTIRQDPPPGTRLDLGPASVIHF